MKLTINGEGRILSAETLSTLVEQLGMKADRVAIELNREIVPRNQWAQTRLHDGDRLEIVQFVGGGTTSEILVPGSPPHESKQLARDRDRTVVGIGGSVVGPGPASVPAGI